MNKNFIKGFEKTSMSMAEIATVGGLTALGGGVVYNSLKKKKKKTEKTAASFSTASKSLGKLITPKSAKAVKPKPMKAPTYKTKSLGGMFGPGAGL